jgi:hypothetical protein
MAELLLYNKKVDSFFDLLGTGEDDISYGLGWCLANSGYFLNHFLSGLFNRTLSKVEQKNISILLQATEREKGRTDFEILLPGEFALIIEAKKGWQLPTSEQLKQYTNRSVFINVRRKLIISLSECKQFYANCYLPKNVNGVTVKHYGFQEINQFLKRAKAETKGIHEKNLLYHFYIYLNKVYRMQKLDSNYVYVVSLGNEIPNNWKISWIDIVKTQNKYFHPVGNTWPKEPPNYIAFRYGGKLQSIHHIKGYEVTKNLSKSFLKITIPFNDHDPHFVYELGEAIKPKENMSIGNIIKRSTKVWCMLDTLLTSKTLSEAYLETKRRWEIMQNQ